MRTIAIYDKPMCCSTGICGPSVDPVLPRFAADLDWLKAQGHVVERYNLAQQPLAFVQNAAVQQLLTEAGVDILPVIMVDGRIVSRREYPTRELLADWARDPGAAANPLVVASAAAVSHGEFDCCNVVDSPSPRPSLTVVSACGDSANGEFDCC